MTPYSIVLIDRDGIAYFFGSPAEAEAGLDLDDVESGEYIAFDKTGRTLTVRHTGDPVHFVSVELAGAPHHEETARATLIKSLTTRGQHEAWSLVDASMTELVRAVFELRRRGE